MTLRDKNLDRLASTTFDVLVIGGGINGAVAASALSAHGASVALVDARDFAGFTSQHSSNLVWGGIKYMENWEFGLVADLCRSRNELMRAFPSAIREIRFLTTIAKGFRHHPLMLWAGAWLYWLFGRGYTRTPMLKSAADIEAKEPLINTANSRGGIEYSDAYLADNDARFVFNFVRDALDRGCAAVNYVRCEALERGDDDLWAATLADTVHGRGLTVKARVVINAAGAFVDGLNAEAGIRTGHQHLFSKGVHLLVPRIATDERVLAFFADDGRLFFAIPMGDRTCIGTTDTRVDDPQTQVTDEDRTFILDNINARLDLPRPLTRDDVIAERCGVRPLAVARGDGGGTDFLQLSRRHVLEVDGANKAVSIYGGKLTDCLNIGAEVCDEVGKLGVALKAPAERWYGEPPEDEHQAFRERARNLQLDGDRAPDTGESLTDRLWRRYGRRAHAVVDAIEQDRGSTAPVIQGTGLRWCEVAYMRDEEMVVHLDDVLRRRSKVSLVATPEQLDDPEALRRAADVIAGEEGEARYEHWAAMKRAEADAH